MYSCDFAQTHPNDALIPSLNDLTVTDHECEWLLSWIFRAPELFCQVIVFSKSSAMNRDTLAFAGEVAVAEFEDCLGESHD